MDDGAGSKRNFTGTFTFSGHEKTRAALIEPLNFSQCPVCLGAGGLTSEHVPMRSLGEVVMTSTCKPCNDILGSVAGEELRRAYHGEVSLRASSSGLGSIRGYRAASATLRRTGEGAAAFIIQNAHPEFIELIEELGSKELTYALINSSLADMALLKYSYLSACLWPREIPHSSSAEATRSVLTAARDGQEQEAKAELKDVVRTLPFVRVDNPELADPRLLIEPTTTQPSWMFVMAGRIAARWPFSGIHSNEGGPLQHVL